MPLFGPGDHKQQGQCFRPEIVLNEHLAVGRSILLEREGSGPEDYLATQQLTDDEQMDSKSVSRCRKARVCKSSQHEENQHRDLKA